MSSQLATVSIDNATIENVLIGGDLSKLTPTQRVSYYKAVCQSIGLNPLTKPFDYILLKTKEGPKLSLYAKKDATDQLRSLNDVSIDDIDIQEKDNLFVVKVKGHDKTGRTDVEIGVVNKNDMFGDLSNVQMKAVTKAKRRLTLSLCGLGWLDETEIETIPTAKPINVTDSGEIIDAETSDPAPSNNGHKEAAPITLEEAVNVVNREGVKYGDLPTEKLTFMLNSVTKKSNLDDDQLLKVEAMKLILKARKDGTLKEPAGLVETAQELGGQTA